VIFGSKALGKLADLWAELKTAKPEEKDEIKKKINDIEQWCIDNNFGNFKEITDWSKPQKTKKKKSDPARSFSFTEENGFITVGNLILPKHEFCKGCGLYKDNGLIWSSEGIIHG